MGSLQAESEEKLEMDDSGCIQDEAPPSKKGDGGTQGVQLLDLSDDVLLLILRFLTPRDLKALGYTCPRLGALALDRPLWQRVDARACPASRARLRWLLARALHAGTTALLLAGHARGPGGCLEHVNQTREEIDAARLAGAGEGDNGKEEDNNNSSEQQSDSQCGLSDRSQSPRIIEVPALGPHAQLFLDNDGDEARVPGAEAGVEAAEAAEGGARLTLERDSLRRLADTCPALAELALEYCNIDCNTTSISQFPRTLRKLSLRGSECYNLPPDRSFLFKIQDALPDLETLDVSECEWMEPATLLPLSKLPALRRLAARACPRLTEFVAYASLATRYGFTKLQSLDLRGSPVGDSEVSALGWLRGLAALWLAPLRAGPRRREPGPRAAPGDLWEDQEPEYFKIKEPLEPAGEPERSAGHTWQAAPAPGRGSTHSATLNTSNGISPQSPAPSPPHPPKRKPSPSPSPSPGPSKRKRPTRDASSSDDDDLPLKCLIDKDKDEDEDKDGDKSVNEGASTSREAPQGEAPPLQNGARLRARAAEPRHHVLCVNVGQQLHAVYRLSLDTDAVVSLSRGSNRIAAGNILLSPPPTHIDATSLVTDSAIRRFGRADGEDINYVHIGPNGPHVAAAGSRPDRSSLTHLTVTGFRHITDRSLEHLATAAPRLRFLDLSETNVTAAGVAGFRGLRPDCEVRYSQFVEKKESTR